LDRGKTGSSPPFITCCEARKRYPALPYIKAGERVAVYNLKGNAERGEFFEAPATVIYLVPINVNAK
jgi:hypothetical protein